MRLGCLIWHTWFRLALPPSTTALQAHNHHNSTTPIIAYTLTGVSEDCSIAQLHFIVVETKGVPSRDQDSLLCFVLVFGQSRPTRVGENTHTKEDEARAFARHVLKFNGELQCHLFMRQ